MPNTSRSQAYLAYDLGAESGRAFLGNLRSDVLTLREIHRFPNLPIDDGGSLYWNTQDLWAEMRKALAMVGEPKLAGIGVDAWGVDYALLGSAGELLGNPRHYRDPRNVSAMDEVLRLVSEEEIYSETGTQFIPINTIYQLFAARRDTPEMFAAARRLLMIPDLFHYWLSGKAVCEYTDASTTQLTNPKTRTWSASLMQRLELPADLPAPLVEPGSVLGGLLAEVAPGSGLAGTPVIAPASHDTASAVAAIMARGDTAFLSSGTWSLLGIELEAPIISPRALRMNLTNEGGVCGTTRLLKNVMGLWMLQRCRHAWAQGGMSLEYGEIAAAANEAPAFQHLVDPDDPAFLNPPSMPEAIAQFCRRTDQPVPQSPGACARTILESLVFKYSLVLRDLEGLTGNPIRQIRVIGGGSKNRLLNQFTADATGRRVIAGPAEAAVLGNIAVQLFATGAVGSLAEARAMIDRSFPAEIFEPRDSDRWNREAERFQQYCEPTYA